jgi:hypothetical protein
MKMRNRRAILKAALGAPFAIHAAPREISLFDGKTLEGWIQVENNATSLSWSSILDQDAFVRKLSEGSDAVSAYLRRQLSETLKTDMKSISDQNRKAVISALMKELNAVVAGASIFQEARFHDVALRPETRNLLRDAPPGRLNKMLLEDALPQDLAKSVTTGWVARDGAMASLGTGRGVIYTKADFSRFRLRFTMRHLSGNPDHQACVLIFCTRPEPGQLPLDALAGIQFQVPNGGHWDYRPGMNNNGGEEFISVNKTHFDPHSWSEIEIIADSVAGTAAMAVAQPPGSRAVEVLRFNHQPAGKTGPIAWQMHNAGLIDEFKDVSIETDPADHELQTISRAN